MVVIGAIVANASKLVKHVFLENAPMTCSRNSTHRVMQIIL